MGQMLRRMGMAIWVAAVWLILAELAGFVPAGTSDVWVWRVIWAGAVPFGLGVLGGVLWPLMRELRRGHCVRCGRRIERGQTYCHDHLQATVNEYRDRAHDTLAGRPGRA